MSMNIHARTAKLFFGIAVLSFGYAGCSFVDASSEHTAGIRALNAGNYDEAVTHLEKSVQEDPSMARHQNTLAAAYYAKGQYRQGWPHVRMAILQRPDDRFVRADFAAYYKKFVDLGWVKNGDSEATVLRNLGLPDGESTRSGAEFWKYGIAVLWFQDGRLANAGEVVLR